MTQDDRIGGTSVVITIEDHNGTRGMCVLTGEIMVHCGPHLGVCGEFHLLIVRSIMMTSCSRLG